MKNVTVLSQRTVIVELIKKGGGGIGLQERMVPCSSREAVVKVTSYKDGMLTGCLRHPRLAEKEEVHSLTQMILLLNGLMDLENCPNPPPSFIRPECDIGGESEVFRIQILFREHYTMQGKLIWQNEKKEFVFHSALELLLLLDEILAE